jgi:hypothetical protein
MMVGGVAVALAVALMVLTGRGSAFSRAVSPGISAPAAATAQGSLELVALSHDRDDDHITVRGVVRNPGTGGSIDQLAAVVFLFDRDGHFIDTARAAIRVPVLAPGSESPFVVTMRATGVGRYRVSFRSGNRVIPHVDRRPSAPAARLQ